MKAFRSISLVLLGLIISIGITAAQTPAKTEAPEVKPVVVKKNWYDTLKLSGYVQGRFYYYDDYPNEERKTGGSSEFTLARARIAAAAEVSERSALYLQIDMGQSKVTVKDAWMSYKITEDGAFWARMGLQRIPFGFEGPQSSTDRPMLERSRLYAWNFPGSRDTGVTLFWTNPKDEVLFATGKKEALGPGNYGSVALGVFNGQGSEIEVNSQKLFSLRLCKPFALGEKKQYAEVGASYYDGSYTSTDSVNYDDDLLGFHAYLAPKPFGLQVEWFDGKTEGDNLNSWYASGFYQTSTKGLAFARYENYDGRRKNKGAGRDWNRDRISLGYAHDLDNRTKVTVEWDIEDVDGSGSIDGYGNDMLGMQLQMKF